jgi:hypothetical protein
MTPACAVSDARNRRRTNPETFGKTTVIPVSDPCLFANFQDSSIRELSSIVLFSARRSATLFCVYRIVFDGPLAQMFPIAA